MQLSLAAARKNAGLTLKEASDLIGVNKSTLQKYEKDSSKIPFELLHELSFVYQVNESLFFVGKEDDLIRTIKSKRDSMNKNSSARG